MKWSTIPKVCSLFCQIRRCSRQRASLPKRFQISLMLYYNTKTFATGKEKTSCFLPFFFQNCIMMSPHQMGRLSHSINKYRPGTNWVFSEKSCDFIYQYVFYLVETEKRQMGRNFTKNVFSSYNRMTQMNSNGLRFKGQLISEWNFGVFKSPKKPTKF